MVLLYGYKNIDYDRRKIKSHTFKMTVKLGSSLDSIHHSCWMGLCII